MPDGDTAMHGAWVRSQGDKKEFVRLIDLDGLPKEGLSFLNLVEAHVLASIRTHPQCLFAPKCEMPSTM